jgi:putative membrane protein
MTEKFEMPIVNAKSESSVVNTELASRRTGMSFQRTRMSADRTLMSVIRTSLSLIGFGFTIAQFFHRLQQANYLRPDSGTAKNFGFSLIALGVLMLVIGIWYHVHFMLGLRSRRREMTSAGLVHAQSEYPISLTLIVAVLLLLIGILAVVGMVFDVGPLA